MSDDETEGASDEGTELSAGEEEEDEDEDEDVDEELGNDVDEDNADEKEDVEEESGRFIEAEEEEAYIEANSDDVIGPNKGGSFGQDQKSEDPTARFRDKDAMDDG